MFIVKRSSGSLIFFVSPIQILPKRGQQLASTVPPYLWHHLGILMLHWIHIRAHLIRTKLYILVAMFEIKYYTFVTKELKPLLPHLNPGDALSPQLRVDRGELTTKSVIVDHFLDNTANLFRSCHFSKFKHFADGELTLVALCRATSAKLK